MFPPFLDGLCAKPTLLLAFCRVFFNMLRC